MPLLIGIAIGAAGTWFIGDTADKISGGALRLLLVAGAGYAAYRIVTK